jgi:nitrate/TMAO reductase-like tetraheme cytochrome c subunit
MKQSAAPSKKRLRLIPALLIAVGVIVLLSAGGFAFAASQESHDPFCASCHTQPESTFVRRSTSTAVDLASYHTTQQTGCIDCHSGQGVPGRMQAELMGARNAFKWFTSTAVQPAVAQTPVGNDNCLKCHQTIMDRNFTAKESIAIPGSSNGRREAGRSNHWHTFLSRWQTADANAATCVTCHSGHATTNGTAATTGGAQTGFMDTPVVQAACNACHQAIRGEG